MNTLKESTNHPDQVTNSKCARLHRQQCELRLSYCIYVRRGSSPQLHSRRTYEHSHI